jgi:hypothetical protein
MYSLYTIYTLYVIYRHLHLLQYGYYAGKTIHYFLAKPKENKDNDEDWVFIEKGESYILETIKEPS